MGIREKMGATAVHPNYRYLQDAIAELTMESGVEVRPYTINEETLMRKYFDMNISAIITDYPETARTLMPIKMRPRVTVSFLFINSGAFLSSKASLYFISFTVSVQDEATEDIKPEPEAESAD